MAIPGKRLLWTLLILPCLLVGVGVVYLLSRPDTSPASRIVRGSVEERIWAIRELAKREPGPDTWAKIAIAASDPDVLVRVAALGALKASGDTQYVPLLAKAARQDKEMLARAAAIDSIAALGGDEAWKTVLEFLYADEAELRAVAVECAGRFGRSEAVTVLRVMYRNDPSQEVRERVGVVLKELDAGPEPLQKAPVKVAGEAIYFEAEDCVRLRRNFELAPSLRELVKFTSGATKDPTYAGIENHSGRGWIRALQGAGGRANYWGGDFLSTDTGRADYPVVVPVAGVYSLWIRVWWMDDCGNSLYAWFDNSPQTYFGSREAEWGEKRFRKWYWHESKRNLRLSAGAHTLHLEVCEDGIRVDAMALLPSGQVPPQGTVTANMNPLALAREGVEVQISCESQEVDSNGKLYATVFVMRNGSKPLDGSLTLDAGKGVPDFESPIAVRLEGDNYVFSKDVAITFPASAPHSESLVRATFRSKEGLHKAEASLIVQKPWPWEYSGPYDAPKDPTTILSDASMSWRSIPPEKIFGRYGVMDFEKVLGNGTHGYMYLRTRVRLPQDAPIRWLLQADDTASVWLDGKLILRDRHRLPLEASLQQVVRQETKGEHLVVVECFQTAKPDRQLFDTQNYWCMRLRARADYHAPADIEGIKY